MPQRHRFIELNTLLLLVCNLPFLLGISSVLIIASIHPLEQYAYHLVIQLLLLFRVILKEALRTISQHIEHRKLLGALYARLAAFVSTDSCEATFGVTFQLTNVEKALEIPATTSPIWCCWPRACLVVLALLFPVGAQCFRHHRQSSKSLISASVPTPVAAAAMPEPTSVKLHSKRQGSEGF